ncbi:hypothetical protein QQG55_53610 [Brugia pahangi]
MTIPKLELLAILIGVRAAQFVIKQMQLENPKDRYQLEHKSPRNVEKRRPIEGEVVLLDEPHAPRGTWKLARIKKLNVANDGYVRSAQIETSSGKLLNRPVSTLYPLEVTPEEQSTPENPANPSERAEPIIQNRNTTTNTKISSESGEEQPIAHRTRSQTNLQKREKSNFVLTNLLLTVAISIILQAAETKECKWTSGVENHNVLSYKPQIYPLEHFSLFPRECREQARNSTRNNLCTEQSNLAKGQI